MCGVELSDKAACQEPRDRLGLKDVVTVLQNDRLRWKDQRSRVTKGL